MKVNIIREYIKSKKCSILLWFICVILMGIILWLSNVEPAVFLYPMILCSAIILIAWLYEGLLFYKRHRVLSMVRHHIDVTLDKLPEAVDLMEQDYQCLLAELMQKKDEKIHALYDIHKDTFDYITLWTHQLKTPITAIRLLAEQMEEDNRSELLFRLFEMEQYCDLMLSYLRMEGDGTDYLLQHYSVRSMVHQAVKYFARIFIYKGISVKVEIPDDIYVITDEKWMVFVLKQLISNALKYTKQGCITISCDCVEQTKDGTDEREISALRIEDTGIGILAEDLPRIFERGYTGYNGRRDKKATGLGLFLSKRILQQIGHSIAITSIPAEGTIVTIDFGNLTKL